MREIWSSYYCHRLRRLHDEHESAIVRSAWVDGVFLEACCYKRTMPLFVRLRATRTDFAELPGVVGRARAHVSIRRAAIETFDVLAERAGPVGRTVADTVPRIVATMLAL